MNTAGEAQSLQSRLARQNRRLEDLATVVWTITSGRNLDQILCALMEVSIRSVGAEVGGIFALEGDRVVERVAWGVDARTAAAIGTERGGVVAQAYATPTVERLGPDRVRTQALDREVFVRHVLVAPIAARDRVHGVMLLVNARGDQAFSEADAEAATLLVSLAAVAIEQARLREEQLARQRIEQQLEIARTVQQTLIPPFDQKLPGIHWEAMYVPAFEVGGDYFDLIPVDSGVYALAVADIASKGLPAALLMTAVRSLVRAEALQRCSTAALVESVNRALCRDFARHPGMLVTLFFAYVDTRSSRLDYTNAGHPPAYLWDQPRGLPSPLTTGGPILGQFEDAKYADTSLHLGHAWRIWTYTDGVTETEDARGELFGTQRAHQFATVHRNLPGQAFMAALCEELNRWAGQNAERDDLTALWIGEAHGA